MPRCTCVLYVKWNNSLLQGFREKDSFKNGKKGWVQAETIIETTKVRVTEYESDYRQQIHDFTWKNEPTCNRW